MLAEVQIAKLLVPYKIDASTELARRIAQYIAILVKWNRKISLTTVTDPLEIVKFHFGESLFAISTGACGKSRLADFGTGAGFPGLALAMTDPDLNVTLIESNLKKCAFLGEVIRQLNISNALVLPRRMESLDSTAGGFDFISARALGQFDELLSFAGERLGVHGRVLLWLGEGDVASVSRKSDWEWDAPILIPGSDRRFILKGSPKAVRQ